MEKIEYDQNENKAYELKYGYGYVKEYRNNNKIFEGEYLNGERNGKGKEYDYNGNIIFEGDYLYGVKIKGKEYIGDKLIFEGEYINEQKWKGKGKEYDSND